MKLSPAIMSTVVICASPMLAWSQGQHDRGAALFQSSGCQHCHMIGRVGGDRGPNLSEVGRTSTPAAIRRQIVHGSDVMPAFGTALNSQKIDDLVAYLRSCRKKAPSD
jgi:mono/diheme cytochrome c family protein